MRTLRIPGKPLSILLATAAITAILLAPAQGKEAERWADAMAAFAAQDAADPYPEGGVVFVGSSSIRAWDLAESFPEMDPPPLNRGFGGSHVSDSVRNADLLVVRHRPRLVVMYAGDNDIADKKSPERVRRDFDQFAEHVLAKLPDTRLAYIAIKPSLARWGLAENICEANDLIRASCEKNQRLTFIDVWAPMLGEDGRPRKEFFVADGLHMTKEGYRVWSTLVEPLFAVGQ